MMNAPLRRLAAELQLDSQGREALNLAFGLACVLRVSHLLELPQAHELLAQLEAAVRNSSGVDRETAQRAGELARSHPGSKIIDGSGHSAVSATHALARALAGRGVDAAEYAAYAQVYSYGRYAVQDADSFAGEFEWQLECLKRLHGEFEPSATSPTSAAADRTPRPVPGRAA